MLRRLLPAAGGLTFVLFLLPAVAGDPAGTKPAELPLTRVVLFNAGVGFFQREGTVEGTARVDLKFPDEDVNDLLKSLLLEDRDGGTVRAVTYDGPYPAGVTLKSFALDVTENPTVGQLLFQARGEEVQITDAAGGVTVGRVVGLERPDPPARPEKDDKAAPPPAGEQVNLLTADGLQSVPLARAKKIKFLRPELEAEFRKALELLAAARGVSHKTVSLTFAGAGKRRVTVGYVTEAPMWKANYRLSLAEKTAMLQGWAAIENATDEDWKDVRVGLVAGRPMAFQMDLYNPLFVPRPTVEPDLFASLRPPEYQGPIAPRMGGGLGAGGFGGGGLGVAGGGLGAGGGVVGFGGGQLGQFGGQYGQFGRPSARDVFGPRLTYEEWAGRRQVPPEEPPRILPADKPGEKGAVLSAAAAVALGDTFEYRVADPVTLPRLKSALLPVLNQPVGCDRVSVYNRAVLEKHPLLGLRLTNRTKLTLAQGPATVYEAGTFAGDARLPDLKPGETRLVSYAVDLGTEVAPTDLDPRTELRAVTVAGGRLGVRRVTTTTTRYRVLNRSPQDRAVVIEHRVTAGRVLAAGVKPTEEARDVYRFEVAAKPNQPVALAVAEEAGAAEQLPILTTNEAALRYYAAAAAASPAVREGLTKVLTLRGAMDDARQAAEAEQAALAAIGDDQARIRANLERVPKDSDAYRRYLKKFDTQETEIETRQAKVKDLQARTTAAATAYREFVQGLKAE